MGRFKIYDASRFVQILNDTNYAKCLMCDKTLKNIMGNIKRHYEQMHCICVDANPTKKKKSKRKAQQNEDNHQQLSGKPKKVYQELKQNLTATTAHTVKDKKDEIIDLEELDIIPKAIITAKITSRSSPQHLETSMKHKVQEKALEHTNLLTKDNKINDTLNKTLNTPISQGEQDLTLKNEVYTNNSCFKHNINKIQITSFDSGQEFFNCLIASNINLNIPLKTLQEGYTFQKSLQSWKEDIPFNVQSQTIGEHMDKLLTKMRQEIIKIASNRLVYLKLDIASTKESNIMLVNIQFIKDFEIKVLTLSILELLNEHLATYLKEKVLKVLECYEIDISRVHSITKDHANNVKYMQKSEKEQLDKLLEYNDYCQHLSEQFPGHSIHFVACDIIKQLNENISQSRDAVKSLRRKMSQLNMKNLPELDNSGSWLTIYDMIKSLLNIREKVQNNNFLNVEVDWIFAKKFEQSFKPIVETVSMLQNNNFIMGDLYREWLLCECELEELAVSNELALYLLQAMQKRKSKLFENSAFLAALYLDPRFCYMGSMHLNDKQKEMAMNYLLEIFNKLKTLQDNENSDSNHPITMERYTKLDKKLGQDMSAPIKTKLETVKTPTSTPFTKIDTKFLKESLQHLQFEERLSFNTNILDYWKIVKHKNPILAKIAEIALAVPATQATINRALNAWPIAVQKRKLNINSDNIENLLLLKLNQDLVEKITLDKHS